MKKKKLQSQNLRKKFYPTKKKEGKTRSKKKVAFAYSLRTLGEILYSPSLNRELKPQAFQSPFWDFSFRNTLKPFVKA